VADIRSEAVADFIPESAADFPRNTHPAPTRRPKYLHRDPGQAFARRVRSIAVNKPSRDGFDQDGAGGDEPAAPDLGWHIYIGRN